jgi:thiol-disulfide isomerase/thioredoxin
MSLALPFTTSIVLAAALTHAAGDDATRLTPITKGGSSKIGYYSPLKSEMAPDKPAGLKKAPEGLVAAQYGVLPIGNGIVFVLDEPDGQPARFWVDTNGNGDLTDDPATEWKGKEDKSNPAKTLTMYSGSAMVDIGEPGKPFLVSLGMYRFDKNDERRAALKSTVLYYRDYGYEGQVAIGGKPHKAMLSDENARGDFRAKPVKDDESSGVMLMLDVNDNGKFDSRGEAFDTAKPFNIGGTTWEIVEMARDGSSFKIVKSSKTVAEIPTPPDHSTGKTITAFEAVDTAKNAVKFPGDFKGKIVLLDFWATWCGPCMREMPNVVKAYDKFHKDGFEILGISLDNKDSIERMPEVMEKAKMTWRQVADGKGWKAEIAQQYVISSIPATFLVDGTTGKILGTDLRGEALDSALEKALAELKKQK